MSQSATCDEISVSFNVKLSRVRDLVDAALYSPMAFGCGYWARVQRRNGKPLESLSEPWSIVFEAYCDGLPYTHTDGRTRFVLDAASIEHGLRVFATKCPRAFGLWMDENEDAPCGDLFMQCCLLGEVVFS